MSFEPVDWNVVILGRWNAAILTPRRIAEKIYKLPMPESGEIQLPVFVPLDGLSPYQIKHTEKNIVTLLLDGNRLIIEAHSRTYESLADAMIFGRNALEWLPETPFSAAGFNIKYRSEEVPDELLDLVTNDTLDSHLSEQDYEIVSRRVVRSMQYETGRLNLTITIDTRGSLIEYNFHQESSDIQVLKNWLSTSPQKLQQTVEALQKKFEPQKETQS